MSAIPALFTLVLHDRRACDDVEPANPGETRDQFLRHSVGEIFVFRIRADVGEWKDSEARLPGYLLRMRDCIRRWAPRHGSFYLPDDTCRHYYRDNRRCADEKKFAIARQGYGRFPGRIGRQDLVGSHRLGNILDLLLPGELELEWKLALDVIVRRARNTDFSRRGQRLQSGGDVHPVAVYRPVLMFDYVAQVDSDAKLHAPVLGKPCVALGKFVLDLNHAVRGFHCTGEFSQYAVACRVDQSPAMGLDAYAEKGAGLVERPDGGLLVVGHQPGVAGGISAEDGAEFAVGGHRRDATGSGARTQRRLSEPVAIC